MHEQTIYFGAPGTGKSHLVDEYIRNKGKIFRVTIHPEYTYSDFIGQLLPFTDTTGTTVKYKFKPGIFTDALKEAHLDTSKNVYLVLEEISRGNVAAIFGDIFQLLDRDELFVSKFHIKNKDIASEIVGIPDDTIFLPSNFNIIGTVNVNDQNVFPMDTAFKRRFDWIYVSSNPAVDASNNRLSKLNNPIIKIAKDSNRSNDIKTNWQSFYTSLNKFITDKTTGLGKNEDKQLGQFFIKFKDSLITDSRAPGNVSDVAAEEINSIIRNKLLLYLWQDVAGYSSFGNSNQLFADNIQSFDDLFSSYGEDKVFSNNFIDNFLIPNINKYPYDGTTI